MDKMSLEELGFFLYMQEMERQQIQEQEEKADEGSDEDDQAD